MLREIATRRSVRRYTAEPIKKEALTELLHAAMNAPSAMDRRPWRLLVVTDRAALDHIAEMHPFAGMVRQAQAAVLVSCDMDEANNREHGYLDCGAAIENLLLEATHQGLGACWCGMSPAQDRVDAFAEYFSLPKSYVPMGLVALGHPGEEKPQEDRYREKDVTWWNA